jgi:hypothetical protein
VVEEVAHKVQDLVLVVVLVEELGDLHMDQEVHLLQVLHLQVITLLQIHLKETMVVKQNLMKLVLVEVEQVVLEEILQVQQVVEWLEQGAQVVQE